MNYFKLNGIKYDVLVTEIEESFNILYSENTGRTVSAGARMTLDPLGCFIGHKITVARKPGNEKAFDDLFDKVSRPRVSGHVVEVVHGQTSIKYDAYISNGARSLQRITKDDVVLWGELQINMVPLEAQILPE